MFLFQGRFWQRRCGHTSLRVVAVTTIRPSPCARAWARLPPVTTLTHPVCWAERVPVRKRAGPEIGRFVGRVLQGLSDFKKLADSVLFVSGFYQESWGGGAVIDCVYVW